MPTIEITRRTRAAFLSAISSSDRHRQRFNPSNKKDTVMRSVNKYMPVQVSRFSQSRAFGAMMFLASAVMSVASAYGQSVEQQTTPPHQTSNPSSDAHLDKLGMEKMAEMTALARHDELCPKIPDEWSAAFTMLLMVATPTEEQVETQERKMLALRHRVGAAKWCQLYSVEMQEAYLIYRAMLGNLPGPRQN